MDEVVTMHQTIALVGVIGIAAIALFLEGYVMVRHNVALAENNIRILTVCLVIPTVVMISFIPDTSIADRSAVYGLIGTIAGYILGRAKDEKQGG
ncbi:hypothetical protein OEZ71_11845 [Defluviimonas sp. WL0050]|uniref:Uncharacterized protein n=1 Tax=Albidovulum litorale TaxID=2984134 RepID=A0ABT2ZPB8_9RHOB|nr:hypothetical protein [Defluviimonas sp. WL0050]MCV2872987.1 hypothetical protein [Defluviimonas sp. WL0050]